MNWDIRERLIKLQREVDELEKKLDEALVLLKMMCPTVSDLQLKVSPDMAKAKKVTMAPVKKGAGAAMTMPPVTLSSLTAGIQLVPVDAAGNPVSLADPTTVTTTLTSDNPAFAITAGADSLHYSATVPPNTTGVANLTATLAFVSGSTPAVNSTIAVTLDVPSGVTDLQIILTSP